MGYGFQEFVLDTRLAGYISSSLRDAIHHPWLLMREQTATSHPGELPANQNQPAFLERHIANHGRETFKYHIGTRHIRDLCAAGFLWKLENLHPRLHIAHRSCIATATAAHYPLSTAHCSQRTRKKIISVAIATTNQGAGNLWHSVTAALAALQSRLRSVRSKTTETLTLLSHLL